jgi:hypothetical protein
MKFGSAEMRQVRIPNEVITWAGDSPWTETYCFGTESGKVLFCREIGDELSLELAGDLAEDPINGVAFHGEFVGVSTRSEVNVHRKSANGNFRLVCPSPGGAHGILATPDGHFIAPMGAEGLFCVDASGAGEPRAWIESVNGTILNLYSLTRLGYSSGKEVLVSASRTDGLSRIEFSAESDHSQINRLTAPDLDFIDVCSLGSTRWPFAVAALCLDRRLILIRDLLTDDQPQVLPIDGVRGTPYAIRCGSGHVFVLTNQHVAVFPDLSVWFLESERRDPPPRFRQRVAHADDIFIARDSELLLLTDGSLDIEDIRHIVAPRKREADASPNAHVPDWKEHGVAPEIAAADIPWLPVPT